MGRKKNSSRMIFKTFSSFRKSLRRKLLYVPGYHRERHSRKKEFFIELRGGNVSGMRVKSARGEITPERENRTKESRKLAFPKPGKKGGKKP